MAKWTYVVVAIAVGGSAIALAIAGLDVDKKQEEAILALPELTREFTSWINNLGAPPIPSPSRHLKLLTFHAFCIINILYTTYLMCLFRVFHLM